jgi:hypothetical protein
MTTVIRYINNTNQDVVAGSFTVPKHDQLIVNDFIQPLDALAGKSLLVLVDGVELHPDLVPANIPTAILATPRMKEKLVDVTE